MVSDETIVIKIHRNLMTEGRYNVCATYSDDPFEFKSQGWGYAQAGILYNLLGIGDSLDVSIKKATCAAIKELKEFHASRLKNIEFIAELEKSAKEHAAKCGDRK